MKQIELVNKIVQLSKENPDAEIKLCVSNDLAADFGWTAHKIKRVELSSWLVINEMCFNGELVII